MNKSVGQGSMCRTGIWERIMPAETYGRIKAEIHSLERKVWGLEGWHGMWLEAWEGARYARKEGRGHGCLQSHPSLGLSFLALEGRGSWPGKQVSGRHLSSTHSGAHAFSWRVKEKSKERLISWLKWILPTPGLFCMSSCFHVFEL